MAEPANALLVHHPTFLHYDFGPAHPLRPERISAGLTLLEALGIWDPASELLTPAPASDDELRSIHAPEYVEAVKAAGDGWLPPEEWIQFGLGPGDTPAFPDMHEPCSYLAGGAAVAARAILRGEARHVFHPAGGLHHALRRRASGFCVYNDPALAAAVAASEFGARVLYVDLDCHHGDGVQWMFYDDPLVLTVSFHESGRYLFPGTGEVTEIGQGEGTGFSANVPFEPFTRDDSWLEALERVVPPLARWFKPDFLISSHGADTHVWDPLTHLALTTRSFDAQTRLLHELAHTLCAGRWLAVGSGGYDWQRVVPRAWAIVWSQMANRDLPSEMPPGWLKEWQGDGEEQTSLVLDDGAVSPPTPRDREIATANARSVDRLQDLLGVSW